jgi:hypothetical protein
MICQDRLGTNAHSESGRSNTTLKTKDDAVGRAVHARAGPQPKHAHGLAQPRAHPHAARKSPRSGCGFAAGGLAQRGSGDGAALGAETPFWQRQFEFILVLARCKHRTFTKSGVTLTF